MVFDDKSSFNHQAVGLPNSSSSGPRRKAVWAETESGMVEKHSK
jgi:hypothetical protein